jgi:hypothetical protein
MSEFLSEETSEGGSIWFKMQGFDWLKNVNVSVRIIIRIQIDYHYSGEAIMGTANGEHSVLAAGFSTYECDFLDLVDK